MYESGGGTQAWFSSVVLSVDPDFNLVALPWKTFICKDHLMAQGGCYDASHHATFQPEGERTCSCQFKVPQSWGRIPLPASHQPELSDITVLSCGAVFILHSHVPSWKMRLLLICKKRKTAIGEQAVCATLGILSTQALGSSAVPCSAVLVQGDTQVALLLLMCLSSFCSCLKRFSANVSSVVKLTQIIFGSRSVWISEAKLG